MTSAKSRLENPLQMAVIGAAHGIRGEVRVKTYTGDPLALGSYGSLYDAAGRAYEVLTIRPSKTVVVVRFKGVEDRNTAEALTGTELFIDRSQLPQDLDEDEFYYTDLIGAQVFDAAGTAYGKVSSVFNFGGGDVLEIKVDGQKPALIPFTQASVTSVDLTLMRLIIDPVAAGLIGEEADENDPMGGDQSDASSKKSSDGWVR